MCWKCKVRPEFLVGNEEADTDWFCDCCGGAINGLSRHYKCHHRQISDFKGTIALLTMEVVDVKQEVARLGGLVRYT